MRYFKRIKVGLNVQPILDEITQHPDPWNLFSGRQEKIAVQREAYSIPLRGLRKSKIQGRKRYDVHESRYTTTANKFPNAVAFIEEFALQQDAKLGRAKLVNLPPGGRVYPHVDQGDYYKIRNRYHFILQTGTQGSLLQCGEESVRMQPGELWWFDNKQLHEAFNDSPTERIHLIFDLLPRARSHMLAGDPLHLIAPVVVGQGLKA